MNPLMAWYVLYRKGGMVDRGADLTRHDIWPILWRAVVFTVACAATARAIILWIGILYGGR